MSFDIYLMPLPQSASFDEAMRVLDHAPNDLPSALPDDARAYISVVLDIDRRYTVETKDFGEIAKLEGITEDEARERYGFIQLIGHDGDGNPLAQFVFDRDRIMIHWYDGTTPDELDALTLALCRATNFAAVDPQEGRILRLREDGTLG